MSVAAVVLAAGASTRLGRAKQTLQLGGESLVERAVRVAQEAGCAPVIVVVNPEGNFGHRLQQRGCIVVVNENSTEGMASSIRRGIVVARRLKAQGAVVMTCDQPGVLPEHLRALAADAAVMTGSAYAGRVGVPAYFPAAAFDALLALQGDTGARGLLRGAKSIPQEELGLDVDTEEDFRKAQALFEH
ncbi:MAG: nucleotidyltransferase family protein [Acidobacteriaceae bacterium]